MAVVFCVGQELQVLASGADSLRFVRPYGDYSAATIGLSDVSKSRESSAFFSKFRFRD